MVDITNPNKKHVTKCVCATGHQGKDHHANIQILWQGDGNKLKLLATPTKETKKNYPVHIWLSPKEALTLAEYLVSYAKENAKN